MRKLYRILLLCTLSLFMVNIILFIFRNSGFDFQKFSTPAELNQVKSEKDLAKWTKVNQQFSTNELQAAKNELNGIGIDSVKYSKNKALKIGAWLHKSFKQQLGKPHDSVSRLAAWQQFLYFIAHKDEQLWCGNLQRMYGLFCTAAGLSNRYLEVVPYASASGDVHELNEVFIPESHKWMMIDVTRDQLAVANSINPLSSSEYMDYMISRGEGSLKCYMSDDSILNISLSGLFDNYFNKNYFLRYYYTVDLAEVYTTTNKLKRYLWGSPWYEVYKPGVQNSNLQFYLRQFFLFCFAVCFLMVAYVWVVHHKK